MTKHLMLTAIAAAIAAYAMLIAKENAKLAAHIGEPLYSCTPVCAPVTKEIERAFGKSNYEIVKDAIEYDRSIRP